MRLHRQMLFVVAAAASTVASGTALSAQSGAHARAGFYGGIGLGYGAGSGGDCTSCEDQRGNGLSGYLAVGGTLSPHWRLGAQANWLWGTNSAEGSTTAFISATATLYPSPVNGLWFEMDAGYGTTAGGNVAVFGSYDVVTSTTGASGFALGGGLGYDLYPGTGALAIVPYVKYFREVSNGTGTRPELWQIGIGVGYGH